MGKLLQAGRAAYWRSLLADLMEVLRPEVKHSEHSLEEPERCRNKSAVLFE